MLPTRPSVVIVGHGSSLSDGAHDAALQHAMTLRQSNRYGSVEVRFLAKQTEKTVLPKGEVFLLPFFMSDGFFVKNRIPAEFELVDGARLEEDRHLFLCDALGVDPELAEIIGTMGQEICRHKGWKPLNTHLLLIAHGSEKSPASEKATLLQQKAVEKRELFRSVSSSFLNQSPSLPEVLGELGQLSGPIVIVGLFAAEGPHATEDVPAEIARWRERRQDHADVEYAGVVGIRPEIVKLIQHSISRRAVQA
ncbi:MAG: hypothetical protein NXI13_06095 [Proteobacteria bacterium]|nr:hypothetical protein [Pseudomonadota bacterium]